MNRVIIGLLVGLFSITACKKAVNAPSDPTTIPTNTPVSSVYSYTPTQTPTMTGTGIQTSTATFTATASRTATVTPTFTTTMTIDPYATPTITNTITNPGMLCYAGIGSDPNQSACVAFDPDLNVATCFLMFDDQPVLNAAVTITDLTSSVSFTLTYESDVPLTGSGGPEVLGIGAYYRNASVSFTAGHQYHLFVDSTKGQITADVLAPNVVSVGGNGDSISWAGTQAGVKVFDSTCAVICYPTSTSSPLDLTSCYSSPGTYTILGSVDNDGTITGVATTGRFRATIANRVVVNR